VPRCVSWQVYAFDASTGAVLWTFTTGYSVESSPALSTFQGRPTVLVGSSDGLLYSLFTSDGSQAWNATTPTGGSLTTGVRLDSTGSAYVGSTDGNVYRVTAPATSMATPKVQAFLTGGPVATTPLVLPTGQVVVGSSDGTVYIITAKYWN
jgi:outer membrane protein assembly factor BamB